MGKRATSRWGTRLAVVLAFTVLGNVAVSGVAAAASRSCIGRAAELCSTSTRTNERTTEQVVDEVTPETESPATVSEPVEATAPTAPATSTVKVGAVRMDHEHHDSEPDPETGVDPDCDEDDADDVDGGDDDEDCTSGGSTDPEPCDDDADDEADEDEDEDADEDECVSPEPPVEVCDDGIDNNEDGDVDEDCEESVTPTPPAPPKPPAPPAGTVVLPKQIDRLPTTGADVTSLFLIGLMLVAIGGASRIRTSPVRVVFAGQGSAAELILIQYLNHVATQRTIRRRRR